MMIERLLAILAPLAAIALAGVQLWRSRGHPLLPAPPRGWFWAAVTGCVVATAALIVTQIQTYLTPHPNPPTLNNIISQLLSGLMIVMLGVVFIRPSPSLLGKQQQTHPPNYKFAAMLMWLYAISVVSLPIAHSTPGGRAWMRQSVDAFIAFWPSFCIAFGVALIIVAVVWLTTTRKAAERVGVILMWVWLIALAVVPNVWPLIIQGQG
jgi:hypothetical protein